MDPLPTELWANIVRYLRKPDWVTLAVTCRFTHMIAQAMIFRQVDLQNDLGSKKLSRFCSSLEDRPELGDLVRVVGIASNGIPGTKKLVDHPIFCRLASFSGLQVLELWGFNLDAEFFPALCTLPRLPMIRVFPSFSGTFPSGGAIESTLVGSANTQLVTSAGVEALEIGRGPASSERLMTHFTLRADKHLLRTLIIRSQHLPDTFTQLLMSAPQLRRLYLPGFAQDPQNPLRAISPEAMPLLEHFSGPAKYCDLFIRGRPVHAVELQFTPTTPFDALLALQGSSTPVTSLTMEFASREMVSGDRASVLQHMPVTLRYFGWSSLESKAQFISWMPALSRLQKLQSIEGFLSDDYTALPLPSSFQQDVVLAVHDACPSLRDFAFQNYPNLPYDIWKRWNDGHWERYSRYFDPWSLTSFLKYKM